MKGYLKTHNAATYFDVDKSFLTKRIGVDFHVGVHFIRPRGAKLLRWNMIALEKWFCDSDEEDVDAIISNMLT